MRSFSSKFCNLLLEHRLAALFLIPLHACINPCTAAAVQLSWMKHQTPAGTAAVSLRNLLYLPRSSRFFSPPPPFFFFSSGFPCTSLYKVQHLLTSVEPGWHRAFFFSFLRRHRSFLHPCSQQNSPAPERWVALTTLFLLLEANSSERGGGI